jgi:hypothetical protein
MRVGFMIAALLAGCDAVFGLHNGHVGDAPSDGFGALVTGTLTETSIPNDANGAPASPVAVPGGGSGTATLSDGTVVPVTFTGAGAFSFPVHHSGEAYVLSFDVDDGRTFNFALAAPVLTVADDVVGRTARVAPTQHTELTVATTHYNPSSGDVVLITSTGVWTADSGSADPTGTAFTFDWRDAVCRSGALGLLDGSAHDALQVTVLHPSPLAPTLYETATQFGQAPDVTLVDGVPAVITAPMAATTVSQTSCFTLVADQQAALDRVVGAVGSSTGGTVGWQLGATAGPAFSAPAAQLLGLSLSITAGSGSGMTVQFANPFPGTGSVVTLDASIPQPRAVPGHDAVIDAAGTQQLVAVPSPSPCPATTTVAFDPTSSAIPTVPTIAGSDIGSDTPTLVVAAGSAVPVAWSLHYVTAPGPVDFYELALVELVPGAGPTELPVKRYDLSTTGSAATIPAGVLASGSYYYVVVQAFAGTPGVAEGDFSTLAYPIRVGRSVSNVFLVETQ